jgi:hypothetical protein
MRAAIISPCPKQFDDQHLPSFHPRLLGANSKSKCNSWASD